MATPAKTAAEITQQKIVTQTFINQFGAYGFNLNDFSADYSEVPANPGDLVKIPLVNRVGSAKPIAGDGSDDFRQGIKDVGSVQLQLVGRQVTVPITMEEYNNGLRFEALTRSLVHSASEEMRSLVESAFINGMQQGKGSALDVGTSDAFSKATLRKKIWSGVKRPGFVPTCYLDPVYYSEIIPENMDDFSEDGAHYGFNAIRVYEPDVETHPGLIGFATNPDALAIAIRQPANISSMKCYDSFAINIQELGVSVTFAVFEDAASGSMYAGLYWLQACEAIKDDSYLVLHNGGSFESDAAVMFENQDIDVTKTGGASQSLGMLTGVTSSNSSAIQLSAGVGADGWITDIAVDTSGNVTATIGENTTGHARTGVVLAMYNVGASTRVVSAMVHQPAK